MKIHFSAPIRDLEKHLQIYELIESTIKKMGHTLARDWLRDYKDKQSNLGHFSEIEWEEINSSTLAAIQDADAVIVEASIPSFSMGYISALALAHKKPLLMLFNAAPQSYIQDSNNSLKRAEVYADKEQLASILTSFLEEVDVNSNNLRFNMVLSRELYNFLKWESASTGKTKAQIVREILKDHIKHRG